MKTRREQDSWAYSFKEPSALVEIKQNEDPFVDAMVSNTRLRCEHCESKTGFKLGAVVGAYSSGNDALNWK